MKKIAVLLTFTLIAGSLNAQWGWIKKAAKVMVAPIVVPHVSIYNAAKAATGNAPPKSIYQPYTDAVGAAGSLVPGLVEVTNYPEKVLMERAQSFVHEISGDYGGFIFDVSTFTQRYYPEFSYALAQNINSVSNGENPLELVGAPLAGAIRAGRERHYPTSKPIPESVKVGLRGYLPESTLQSARYTVGNVEITIGNIINRLIKFGDAHAVTLGDVIVFSSDPGSFSDSPQWWAHELAHVQQYVDMGVESFAFNYMRDFGKSIERAADNFALNVIGKSVINQDNFLFALGVGTTEQAEYIYKLWSNEDYETLNEYSKNISDEYNSRRKVIKHGYSKDGVPPPANNLPPGTIKN